MTDNQPRIAMITGGNSGIGFATVRKLAAQGFHVILASRNQQASAQAITADPRRHSTCHCRVNPA